jgi:hypothetical protein
MHPYDNHEDRCYPCVGTLVHAASPATNRQDDIDWRSDVEGLVNCSQNVAVQTNRCQMQKTIKREQIGQTRDWKAKENLCLEYDIC